LINRKNSFSILKFEFLSTGSKYLFLKISAQKQENQPVQAIADIFKRIFGTPGK
jgi:hypothetical protein